MMNLDARKREINHCQGMADDAGIEVNVINMYQALYTQHKMVHGSFKKYIGTAQYDIKMQERYDFIFDNINDTIESKLMYGPK